MGKVKSDEMDEIEFRYTYPLIFLDFIDYLSGENLYTQLHQYEFPHAYNVLIQYESMEL